MPKDTIIYPICIPIVLWAVGFFDLGEKYDMKVKSVLMDEAAMNRALMRISHEILERNKGTEDVVIVGVRRRGARLAEIIADNIERIEGVRVPCCDIDISFYRDDLTTLAESPVLNESALGFSIADKRVVLVDDVLYTGRTARAAIEAIFSSGRPRAIQLAILIDRGHRELPIRADYVGKSVPTSHTELVSVLVPPFDDEAAVKLLDI